MKGNKVLAVFGALAVFFSIGMTGCSKKEAAPTSSETIDNETVPSILKVDISTLLTSQQVSSALGVTVGDVQVYESGTVAHYATEDAKSLAEISLMECDREKYDSVVALYSDAAVTPNLGEAAKWSAQAKQLLVYGKGYMISITADVVNKNSNSLLVSARQLGALVLDKL